MSVKPHCVTFPIISCKKKIIEVSNYLQNLVAICMNKFSLKNDPIFMIDSRSTSIIRMLCHLSLLIVFIFPLWGSQLEETLEKANAYYQKGKQATSFEEQQRAFNQSLFLFNQLERETKGSIPNIHFMLADNYIQLREYPWAILYYQRALKQDPDNPLINSHLENIQKRLGLPTHPPSSFKQGLFSLLYKSNLLFWAILITFFTCSAAIWFSYPWIRKMAIISLMLLALLLCQFGFFYYSTPLEGILIHPSGFYRIPDENQSQLTDRPLLAGSKVKILQISENGDWLKIENANDVIGYLPTANLRLI